MKFGIQLYNLRRELTEDFRTTMKKVAELGFDGVEFAFLYGGMNPAELAEFLHDLKLECCGAMFKPDELKDVENPAWEYAKALNLPAISINNTSDFRVTWQSAMADCLTILANAQAHGVGFAYHNHWGEFVEIDGVPALYRIMDAPEAQKILLEPDICWLNRAGVDAPTYIRKYASRIRQLHFKDITVPDNPLHTVALGKGIIDLKSSYRAAVEVGVPWLIYEQDNSSDAFRDAKDSLNYMRAL